jgi:hypothetical protein
MEQRGKLVRMALHSVVILIGDKIYNLNGVVRSPYDVSFTH